MAACKKIDLIFSLFLLISFSASGNTIYVTSNADSGPGSLREAINQANGNGNTVYDSILFNIPDITQTGRTITLFNELPAISSRIVIDGTSQPGTPIGISSARVILYLDHFTAVPFTFLFIKDAQQVSVFGICFRFFDNPDAGGGLNYAIGLRNSSAILIGAPGKGNMFAAVRFSITNDFWNYTGDLVKDITIQGNVFGHNPFNANTGRGRIFLTGAENIIIGGDTPAAGNIFTNTGITIYEKVTAVSGFFVKIRNNIFGAQWDRTTYFSEGGDIELWGNEADAALTKLMTEILDNFMVRGNIGISFVDHLIHVKGNKLGTDITGTNCVSNVSLGLQACKNSIIGGYSAAEENYINGDIYIEKHGAHIIKNVISGNISVGSVKSPVLDPYIKIITYENNLITGKANPNSKIQLYTQDCSSYCRNKIFYAITYSDANGDWSFPYTSADPPFTATATMPDSSTSEFTSPKVDNSLIKLGNASCSKDNGFITGILVTEGTYIQWVNSQNQVVSNDTSLVNVPSGTYTLMISNGAIGCPRKITYTIDDVQLPPTISVNITSTSCGQFNGLISGSVPPGFEMVWLDNNLDSIGTATGSGSGVGNLAPGDYYCRVRYILDTSCNRLFGPFNIPNQSGPLLNTANIQVTSASCGNSNGGITGVFTANTTGMEHFIWLDSLGQVVGTTNDLLNVPAGKYQLKFKDDGPCDTITTPFYIVDDPTRISVTGIEKSDPGCDLPNGFIRVTQFSTDPAAFQLSWIDESSNQVIGTGNSISGLGAGNYTLKATAQSGCEQIIYETTLVLRPKPQFDLADLIINDDHCSLEQGSITGARFNYLNGPTRYTWTNEQNIPVGDKQDLLNIGKGRYKLTVTDGGNCSIETNWYDVGNQDNGLPPPRFSNPVIRRNTSAVLVPLDPQAGTYYFYSDPQGSQLITMNQSGEYKTPELIDDTYYYVRFESGSCRSSLTPVKVTVVDKSDIYIPSGFTPNQDGKNDLFRITALGQVKLRQFAVYNRWGQMVFATTNFSDGWDGNFNGKPLNAGIFVWTLSAIDELTGEVINRKGTVALIR